MKQLADGGVVVLFPSGVVMRSKTMFGPPVEAEWNLFTAKMIQKSGAVVVPIYFPGSNSRVYHIANKISPTLRQGLLLREVVHSLNKPQKPVVGHAIGREVIEDWAGNPRGFMAWLRQTTLDLKDRD